MCFFENFIKRMLDISKKKCNFAPKKCAKALKINNEDEKDLSNTSN